MREQIHLSHTTSSLMPSSLSVPLTSVRRFRVRDLSEHYDAPAFDLVFHDTENGVERHSEAVWSSKEQAALEAERLDAAQLRPVHWEVCRQKSGNLLNF